MAYVIRIGSLQLPTNPEKLKKEKTRKAKEYNVIGLGAVPKLEDAALDRWIFDFDVFPNNDLDSEIFSSSDKVITYLSDLLKTGKSIDLVISNGLNFGESASVYVTSFDRTEIGIGEYECSIELTEYIEANARITDIPFIQRPGIIPVKTPVSVPPGKSTYNKVKEESQKSGWAPDHYTIYGQPSKPVKNPITEYEVNIYPPNSYQGWQDRQNYQSQQQTVDKGLVNSKPNMGI
ncbi:MAG: hypothetical protein ACK5L6_10215 [Anaerorhabdus sp.]|uniref:hypothetical protein n=1 Tax=Anaerorhabdus sp. TaxID=1872524 RepID=UPI003A8B4C38